MGFGCGAGSLVGFAVLRPVGAAAAASAAACSSGGGLILTTLAPRLPLGAMIMRRMWSKISSGNLAMGMVFSSSSGAKAIVLKSRSPPRSMDMESKSFANSSGRDSCALSCLSVDVGGAPIAVRSSKDA